jgi:hypothetical protein
MSTKTSATNCSLAPSWAKNIWVLQLIRQLTAHKHLQLLAKYNLLMRFHCSVSMHKCTVKMLSIGSFGYDTH